MIQNSLKAELIHQEDIKDHTIEGTSKSSNLSETKISPKILCDKKTILTEKIMMETPKKHSNSIIKRLNIKSFKERIKNLPIFPLNTVEHSHVHNDYCGHITVIHGNHVDYLSEGELHFTSISGDIYPHKLGVTAENPEKCEVQNFQLDKDSNSEEKDIYLEKSQTKAVFVK